MTSHHAYHFVIGRGRHQPLDGEVGDLVEGQVHQVAPQVVPVEQPEKGLGGELEDHLQEAAGRLVLQEHQQGAGGRRRRRSRRWRMRFITYNTGCVSSLAVQMSNSQRYLYLNPGVEGKLQN